MTNANHKSFGQLLDEYLADYPNYETIVFLHDKDANPILLVTQFDESYDYSDVFTEAIDLRAEIVEKKNEVERLNAKIRELKKDQKSLEAALKKIARFQS